MFCSRNCSIRLNYIILLIKPGESHISETLKIYLVSLIISPEDRIWCLEFSQINGFIRWFSFLQLMKMWTFHVSWSIRETLNSALIIPPFLFSENETSFGLKCWVFLLWISSFSCFASVLMHVFVTEMENSWNIYFIYCEAERFRNNKHIFYLCSFQSELC